MIVVAALGEKQAILEELVHRAEILAEKRAARFRDRVFLDFAPDAAEGAADLADHVFAVGLELGDLRTQDVGLLAVLEDLAATANVVLALDQDARKLVAGLLADEFHEGEAVKDVGVD